MDDIAAPTKFGIGQPIRRLEDVRLLTGKGRYQDDQTLHRQTWCVFVRSPHAHARIRSVDTAAKKVTVGAKEIPYDYLILATGSRHSYFGNDQWEKLAPGLKSLEDEIGRASCRERV